MSTKSKLQSASSATDTRLVGLAGEHYVMTQLLRLGLIPALAPVGAPNIDILVSKPLGQPLGSLQVKTRRARGVDQGWHLGVKHESIIDPHLWYALVDLGADEKAAVQCYVIPSRIVAEVIRRQFQAYVSQPGKNGFVRNKESTMRRLVRDPGRYGCSDYPAHWMEPYLDNWSGFLSAAQPKTD